MYRKFVTLQIKQRVPQKDISRRVAIMDVRRRRGYIFYRHTRAFVVIGATTSFEIAPFEYCERRQEITDTRRGKNFLHRHSPEFIIFGDGQ